jgi:DNA polymerase IIIc chi subunit
MTDETNNDNVVSIFGGDAGDEFVPHELCTEENKIKASDILLSIAEDTDRPLDDVVVISTTPEGGMELFSNVSDILRLIGMLEKVKGRLVE